MTRLICSFSYYLFGFAGFTFGSDCTSSLSLLTFTFSELNKIRDGICELETFLREAMKTLDDVEAKEGLQAPTNIPDVLKPCLNIVIGICDKCRQGQRLS